jgi:probable HAF family extracellular repeat protein
MKQWFCTLMILGLFLGMAGQATGQATYTFTTIDVPGAYGNNTPTGINASGQIVGWYDDVTDRHGFLLDQGTYTTFDVPGSARTEAYGINASGQIVGSYDNRHGFLLNQGSYTTLDVPGFSDPDRFYIINYATGINDSGQVVGWCLDVDNQTIHGFLFDQGSYTTIDVPGIPTGINAAGQIVGYYYDGRQHGFLIDHGNYTTIDVPGSISSSASGINASGQIVGSYSDAAGKSHGFLLDQGNYTTLDVPGAFSTGASLINDSGQIVGYYYDANGYHSFLLSNGIYTTLAVPGAYATGINASGQIVGTYRDAHGVHGFVATPVPFHITAASTAVSGTPFDLTVTALDLYGNIDTNYQGTVTFSSSDAYPGVLPADYTFASSDQGTHTFTGGVTLFTAGTQTLTVQDTANGSITGSATVTVVAAPASQFLVTGPATAVSGTAFDVMLAALDPYGNVDMNYRGTVTWTSSDTDPGVLLPPDYPFQPTDNGKVTFPAGVTLITLGNQTFTATDTVSGITGSATIVVGP